MYRPGLEPGLFLDSPSIVFLATDPSLGHFAPEISTLPSAMNIPVTSTVHYTCHEGAEAAHLNGEPGCAIKLGGNQFGEFGRDIFNRIFCSAQTASRPKQGADIAESFIRRAMHDGH